MEKKTSVPIFQFFQFSKKEMFFDPSFKESYNYLIIRYLYIYNIWEKEGNEPLKN